MAQAHAGGFVHGDSLRFEPEPDGYRLFGEVACRGRILITVEKTLESLGGEGLDALVQTVKYSYNASVQGIGNFLRYDNIHTHPGHMDPHHRHDMNWRTSEELPGSPSWVGVTGWPTLGAFIDEVEAWYWENWAELPEPGALARLGLRRK